jgi:hypothetical protein
MVMYAPACTRGFAYATAARPGPEMGEAAFVFAEVVKRMTIATRASVSCRPRPRPGQPGLIMGKWP